MRSPWSPRLGGCGALGWKRYRACEGPFPAAKARQRQCPRLSSHLALGLSGVLMASQKKPGLRWSPSWSQNLHQPLTKIPENLGLPTWLRSK